MYDVVELPTIAAGHTVPGRTPMILAVAAAIATLGLLAAASVNFFLHWG